MRVPYIDLQSQNTEIIKNIKAKLDALMKRGDFILGQDVVEFEKLFSDFTGVPYCLGVNSGTDALFLGLLSLGVGSGDEVIVPTYTYIASAFAVTYTGAKPVFVDIDASTFNIDPRKIEKVVTKKTKAVMPVHLYGQSADMDALFEVANKHGLSIIEDAAQAHGSEYKGKKVGSLGSIGAFSFYPTKNLGAFGDGGMVVTKDKDLFEKVKKLRDYGRKSRYEHTSIGYNSRLDSIQAAILNVKLKKIDQWNSQRAEVAYYYKKLLKSVSEIRLPQEAAYGKHVWHIFAVRIKDRDRIQEELKKAGIATMVHYPVPLHLQEVYKPLGHHKGDFPVAEEICGDVLCLPIYPQMKKDQVEYVVTQLKKLITNS